MGLNKEDRILIKNLYLLKGYGAKRLIKKFPTKCWKKNYTEWFLEAITNHRFRGERKVGWERCVQLKTIKHWCCQWTCLKSRRCTTISPYHSTDCQRNWQETSSLPASMFSVVRTVLSRPLPSSAIVLPLPWKPCRWFSTNINIFKSNRCTIERRDCLPKIFHISRVLTKLC